MRCPWGTIDQKSNLNISKDGTFDLSAKQLSDVISHVLIAKVRPHYYTSTIQSKHRNGFFCTYSFIIEKHMDGFFSVNQMDKRLFPAAANY